MVFSESAWFKQGEQNHDRMALQASWQKTGSLDVSGIDNKTKMEFAEDKMAEVQNAMVALTKESMDDERQTQAMMKKVNQLEEQRRILETIYAQYGDPIKVQNEHDQFLRELYPDQPPTSLYQETQKDDPLDLSDLVRFLHTSEQAQNSWKQMAVKAENMDEDFDQAHQTWLHLEKKREQTYNSLSEQMKKSLSEVGIESEQKMTAMIESFKRIMGDKAFEQIDLYA